MLDPTGLIRAAPFLLVGALLLLLRARLPQTTRQSVHAAREVLLTAPFVILYFVARGFADAEPGEAMAHARGLIQLERSLGIFHEPALQRLILGHNWAMDLANWIYIWGHWPVIITIFVWLAFTHHDRIGLYRNALILSGLMGVAIFLALPVAPPRLMEGYGFVDTVMLRSRAYRVLQPPSLEDLYASMPSLHVGWNFLMGLALAREATHRGLRLFGVLLPILMYTAVVLTANHYFVDGLVGVAIVAISFVLFSWLRRRRLKAAVA